MFIFSLIMLISGILVFCMKRKHLLLMLLSLEFIVLSIYFNMYMMMLFFSFEYYFLMIYLTMSVCEGVLGLSILVSLIRTHGSDYLKSYSMLW
uniref:NADH-ubiquinone oxidoreductase chain 4L n=1 Tax=Tychobythinus sp. 1 EF-2015 TaxID=1756873 RepID=A0A0S2M9G1_9COLE|nr:NADH deshydrogenase subunit 4L [Tychobythinus sp. 1 EF-2015]